MIVCITTLLIMFPFLLGFSVLAFLVFFLFSTFSYARVAVFSLARYVLLSSSTQNPPHLSFPRAYPHTIHTYTRARPDTSRSNVHRRDDLGGRSEIRYDSRLQKARTIMAHLFAQMDCRIDTLPPRAFSHIQLQRMRGAHMVGWWSNLGHVNEKAFS